MASEGKKRKRKEVTGKDPKMNPITIARFDEWDIIVVDKGDLWTCINLQILGAWLSGLLQPSRLKKGNVLSDRWALFPGMPAPFELSAHLERQEPKLTPTPKKWSVFCAEGSRSCSHLENIDHDSFLQFYLGTQGVNQCVYTYFYTL